MTTSAGSQPRRLLPLLLAFLLAFLWWSLAGWMLFPFYAELLIPATQAVFARIRPHGLLVDLANDYPWVRWSFDSETFGPQRGRLSFLVLVYNTVIYLALLSAAPGLRPRNRMLALLTGLPVVFAFHVFDLSMMIESRLLTVVQAEHYDFTRHFGWRFTMIKVYNFLSLMALKQVAFVVLFAVQWHWLEGFGKRTET